ncbi:hypothetical protein [Streptomyces sp. MH13]|uniref:hypothetical protein n=1 Tax=Streptomyces sp. MH13 TaxID=3417651 RepID=UPI003CEADEBE
MVLRLSPEPRERLAQRTADTERIRRLQFLKTHLYDHPGLVVLDRLERHPGRLPDEETAALQRLARTIKGCDQWWYPLLEQWEQLGDGFSDADKQQRAMLALLNSVAALNGSASSAAQAPANKRSSHGPWHVANKDSHREACPLESRALPPDQPAGPAPATAKQDAAVLRHGLAAGPHAART